uniref:Uncharacterized protein n=1 Tax=Rhipicephalus zambeziensis TaxID=60191 RepID=A0A224Y529_9ACAR
MFLQSTRSCASCCHVIPGQMRLTLTSLRAKWSHVMWSRVWVGQQRRINHARSKYQKARPINTVAATVRHQRCVLPRRSPRFPKRDSLLPGRDNGSDKPTPNTQPELSRTSGVDNVMILIMPAVYENGIAFMNGCGARTQ